MDSGKPSLLRRLAMKMAALGADPRPPFQRARNLILRPARHELADARKEIAALREQFAVLRAESEALRDGLGAAQLAAAASLSATTEALATDRKRQAGLEARHEQHTRRLALLERLQVGAPESIPPATEPPLVSIVLPTRNRAALVCEAIESVLAQHYRNWELIVVDDGSEDGTAQALARFQDPRIRVERIAHRGVCGARNHALALARGSLFAYLDSDNLWYPGFLAVAVAALAADPAHSFVYGALASELPRHDGLHLLLEEFDRARLLRENYIDLNSVVHRRELYDSLGGFDEALQRAVDWELALRYTATQPARALPVLAARYRTCDGIRITDTVPLGPSLLAIRRRLDSPRLPARRPRVLYVVWHYPQLSEAYIEVEVRCMLRWGAEVEVWREARPVSPYEPLVPVVEGSIEEAVRRFKPDVIHVHWLFYALAQGEVLAATGVPVTLRLHGFDATTWQLSELLSKPWLHRIYAFPLQLALAPPDPRMMVVRSAVDTSYFAPAAVKDPRLVVRTSASLASKDIELFFELAKRLPDHRFVFAGVTCNEHEHMPGYLRELRERMQSPVELHFDMPRAQVAELVGRAGIYLHTIHRPGSPQGAPIGQPISIAEAMATGAWVLVRDEPELVDYVGDVGAVYADADEAAALIEASTRWSESQWQSARIRASDRAFVFHADEVVLRPVYEDWCALASRHGAGLPSGLAGAV